MLAQRPGFLWNGRFCGSSEGKVCLFSPGFCADFLKSLDRAGYPFFHGIKAFLNFVKQRIVDSFLKKKLYIPRDIYGSLRLFMYLVFFLCHFGLPPSSPPAKKHAMNSQTEEFTYGGGKWAKLGFMMLTAKRVDWADTNAKLKEPVVERMFFFGQTKNHPQKSI